MVIVSVQRYKQTNRKSHCGTGYTGAPAHVHRPAQTATPSSRSPRRPHNMTRPQPPHGPPTDGTFPFLELPIELQIEAITHITDLDALRSLLRIPEILEKLFTFFRFVSSDPDNGPTFFEDLDPRVRRLDYMSDNAQTGFPETTETSKAVIYLVELSFPMFPSMLAHFENRLQNKQTFIAAFIDKSKIIGDDSPVFGSSMALCLSANCCAAKIRSDNRGCFLCHQHQLPHPWPRNIMLSDIAELCILSPCNSPKCYQAMGPIPYKGRLKLLSLRRFDSILAKGQWDAYKRLIKTAEWVYITPTQQDDFRDGRTPIFPDDGVARPPNFFLLQKDEYRQRHPYLGKAGAVLEDLDFGSSTNDLRVDYCEKVTSVRINGSGEDPSLRLTTVPRGFILSRKYSEWQPPVLESLHAPGIESFYLRCAVFFPIFKDVCLPNLKKLSFRGVQSPYPTFMGHVNREQASCLSNILRSVKDLELNDAFFPLFRILEGDALRAIEKLSLFSQGETDADDITQFECLRADMPGLTSLHWVMSDRFLNLVRRQNHGCFGFVRAPALKSLQLSINGSVVPFRQIQICFPNLFALRVNPGPYWKVPDMINVSTPQIPTLALENLTSLILSVPHCYDSIKHYAFPSLRLLRLPLCFGDLENGVLDGRHMPKLEDLMIFDSAGRQLIGDFDAESCWIIRGFPKLAYLIAYPYIRKLLFERCPLLKDILLECKSAPLYSMTSDCPLPELVSLEYASRTGQLVHDFVVPRGAFISIYNTETKKFVKLRKQH